MKYTISSEVFLNDMQLSKNFFGYYWQLFSCCMKCNFFLQCVCRKLRDFVVCQKRFVVEMNSFTTK